MAKITNINNLNIVWRGQSWSVISPTGDVIGRFKEKQDAIRFATISEDYVKAKSPLPFDEKPKSKFSGADGEINLEVADAFWLENKDIVEKPKTAPQPYSGIAALSCGLVGFLIIAGVLLILFLVARSAVSNVIQFISEVFSAPNILMAQNTEPLLGIASILAPLLLLSLNALPSATVRMLLGIPLTLIGLLGFIVGLVAGIIFFAISIFTVEDDSGRILMIFLLWLWISFCVTFLGAKMVDQ